MDPKYALIANLKLPKQFMNYCVHRYAHTVRLTDNSNRLGAILMVGEV